MFRSYFLKSKTNRTIYQLLNVNIGNGFWIVEKKFESLST